MSAMVGLGSLPAVAAPKAPIPASVALRGVFPPSDDSKRLLPTAPSVINFGNLGTPGFATSRKPIISSGDDDEEDMDSGSDEVPVQPTVSLPSSRVVPRAMAPRPVAPPQPRAAPIPITTAAAADDPSWNRMGGAQPADGADDAEAVEEGDDGDSGRGVNLDQMFGLGRDGAPPPTSLRVQAFWGRPPDRPTAAAPKETKRRGDRKYKRVMSRTLYGEPDPEEAKEEGDEAATPAEATTGKRTRTRDGSDLTPAYVTFPPGTGIARLHDRMKTISGHMLLGPDPLLSEIHDIASVNALYGAAVVLADGRFDGPVNVAEIISAIAADPELVSTIALSYQTLHDTMPNTWIGRHTLLDVLMDDNDYFCNWCGVVYAEQLAMRGVMMAKPPDHERGKPAEYRQAKPTPYQLMTLRDTKRRVQEYYRNKR